MEKRRLVKAITSVAIVGLLLLPQVYSGVPPDGSTKARAGEEAAWAGEPRRENAGGGLLAEADPPDVLDPRFVGRAKGLLDAEHTWLRQYSRERKEAENRRTGVAAAGVVFGHRGAADLSGVVVNSPTQPGVAGAHVASVEETIGPPGLEDSVATYLAWRTTCPAAYQRLIDTGRDLLLGRPTYPATDEFNKAAVLAYYGYKWDCWIAYMGFPHSPFCGIGLECVVYLTTRGRPWENALIVLEFESTFGLGAPDNPFGFSGYSNIVMYCNFLDNGLGYRCPDDVDGMVEYYHNPEDAGHAKYRQSFRDRITQLQAFWP